MNKPLLIYDGHCGFCKLWLQYWKRLTGDRVDYAPSQEVEDSFPQISREQFGEAVQLVFPNGGSVSGAEAAFRTLQIAGSPWTLWAYTHVPGFAAISEAAYRLIARHRPFFYYVTKLLFGADIRPGEYARVEWVFLKALGIIYLAAFLSLGTQVLGLIGQNGISPARGFLERVTEAIGPAGYRVFPTIFWLGASDRALQWGCIAGSVFAVLIVLGWMQRAALLGAWVLYLSLVSVGQDFLSFQWDMLLLEAGFLAIFLGYSRAIIWLFRCLLFRLMFLSGAVKLLSGDRTWRGLTALDFHYQTQPLPTPTAWYMQQLPGWFQHLSVGMVFAIELFVPFLIFAPRRLRLFAAACLVLLQILILLTGNYAFFNLLALALCLFLLEDRDLRLPEFAVKVPRLSHRVRLPLTVAVVFVILFLGLGHLIGQFLTLPPGVGRLMSFAAPFGIVNSYGLFAVMTTTRLEIVVEGSDDRSHWQAYEFRYKPGDLHRRPAWVAPHQPRLDWQMWFAALGTYAENPWFVSLMGRLLQGAPEVLRLLDRNPFAERPPRYVRALMYEYRFTDFKTRRETGNWWSRELLGSYLPAISLEDLQRGGTTR
jgi:predicted DCC family thiol-disulfide oxidoreductase YuxK